MPDRRAGFTLIEVMVALSVFAIAGLALVNAQTESLRASGGLEARLVAQIVAENRVVEIMTAPAPPDIGIRSGEVEMAGRRWRWTQRTLETGVGMRRVDVDVKREGADQVLAGVTAFRGAAP